MKQITIDGGHAETDHREPPRLGPLIAVAAVVVLGTFALLSGAGDDDPEAAARDIAATTTTSIPPTTVALEEVAPTPRVTEVEIPLADLLGGPRFTWTEIELPGELSAVFEAGEFAGLPAVIGSTDSGPQPVGAVLYLMGADGRWEEPVEVFGGDRVFTAGVITERGFTVVSSAGSRRWPVESGQDATVHGSADGRFWTDTALSGPDAGLIVRDVAADDAATWLLGWRTNGEPVEVADALPEEARALLDDPLVSVAVTGGRVTVQFLYGLPLYETTLDDLGLEVDSVPLVYYDPTLWVSHDNLTFTELPHALDGVNPYGPLGGSSGVGVYAAVDDRGSQVVLGSIDGLTWSVVDEAAQVLWAHGLGDLLLMTSLADREGRSIEVAGPERRTRYSFIVGSSQDWAASPAVGNGGYVIPTTTISPSEPRPTIIDREGMTITVHPTGSLEVADASGPIAAYSLFGDANGIRYDFADGVLVLEDEQGDPITTLTLDELGSAYLRREVEAPQASGGVLFTPDGERWGWTPLLDVSRTPGPISAAAVGEEVIYVVSSSATRGPDGELMLRPLLYMGRHDG